MVPIYYAFSAVDANKYIELSKFYNDNTTKSVLVRVLTDILKMLHPFMPYVTEEIYGMMPIKEAEELEEHCKRFQYTKAGFIRDAIKEKIEKDISNNMR